MPTPTPFSQAIRAAGAREEAQAHTRDPHPNPDVQAHAYMTTRRLEDAYTRLHTRLTEEERQAITLIRHALAEIEDGEREGDWHE